MELYFKDLISNDASLDKLVDDLTLGADQFVEHIGASISEQSRREVAGKLNRLKESCERLKENAIAGAHATDKLLREHPYWTVGIMAGTALAIGWWLGGRKRAS